MFHFSHTNKVSFFSLFVHLNHSFYICHFVFHLFSSSFLLHLTNYYFSLLSFSISFILHFTIFSFHLYSSSSSQFFFFLHLPSLSFPLPAIIWDVGNVRLPLFCFISLLFPPFLHYNSRSI